MAVRTVPGETGKDDRQHVSSPLLVMWVPHRESDFEDSTSCLGVKNDPNRCKRCVKVSGIYHARPWSLATSRIMWICIGYGKDIGFAAYPVPMMINVLL